MPGTGSRYTIPRLIPAPVRGTNKKTMNTEFETWYEQIKTGLIQKDASFEELYQILVQMKNEEIKRETAYNILIELRKLNLIDVQDDLLVDLMDVVENFCSPRLRIWE